MFGDSSPEPKDYMRVQAYRIYFNNPFAACAQEIADSLTEASVSPELEQVLWEGDGRWEMVAFIPRSVKAGSIYLSLKSSAYRFL